ncbi:helix-turn-helix domain-containing protein [Chitinophaga solisilvae]|uniref:helix-turn-helix domain-containing protein n=1 Tax=Chitinophaga solisilvae TaxID=1233460 RepID=UPI00136ADC6A|nr:AraC family transcriptional regulator [Chitinophaga solisilvae]
MYLQTLPKVFHAANEITPPVYPDHFLYAETMRQPYDSPAHPAGIGLLLSGGGTCGYYVNGGKNPVQAQQVFFINRGSRLAVSTGKEVAPVMLFFHSGMPDLIQYSLHYEDEKLLDAPFDSLPYDFSYLERMHTNPALHQTIISLITLGNSCSSFAALRADIIIRSLFEDLLKANREAFRRSQNIQAVKVATRREIFKRIALAREWLEAHYAGNVTLEDMAVIATMNSQHFLRMFKQAYLITPHQYQIELKLRKAVQLLETTLMPVQDICLEIGFESVFSFSVLFKERFGTPPAAFRKEAAG